MLTVRHLILDEKTGELVEKDFRELQPPRRKEKDFRFVKDDATIRLAQLPLCGSDLRIILLLAGVCNWANQVNISRKQIAESLQLSRQQVARSLQTLARHGLLISDPDDSSHFELHPGIAWKGSPDGWSGVIDRFEWVLARRG